MLTIYYTSPTKRIYVQAVLEAQLVTRTADKLHIRARIWENAEAKAMYPQHSLHEEIFIVNTFEVPANTVDIERVLVKLGRVREVS
jgi:hypothetical protein